MAVPSSFVESNEVLDKPREMSREECDALAVLRTETVNGFPAIVSCWKLTREELDEINKTGRIWLSVIGNNMPPVYLAGTKPFTMMIAR
jgi:hypothetical protein